MKILLIDDHALFREGLKALLPRLDASVRLIEAAGCAEGLAELNERGDLNLALLDLGLGDGKDRLCCLRRLRKADPTLPVVIISAHEGSTTVTAAFREGASGYIPKSSPTAVVLDALRQVLSGGVYFPCDVSIGAKAIREDPLTKRQRQVLELMAHGEPNKTIARRLGTAEGTVRIHVTAVIKALGAANRTEAVSKAIRLGYVADLAEP